MKIVAAAILWKGITFTGTRHGHIIRDIVALGMIERPEFIGPDEQGFIESEGNFVHRDHARTIAIAAGQITPEHGTLYSEDLWPAEPQPDVRGQ